MPLDLVVLGANSALPLLHRFSSSFVLRSSTESFLIDAGEGCQIKLGQFKIKRSKIGHIFISHLHGDHLYGLPGLITSLNLNARKSPLSIYGPKGIKKYLETIFEVSEVKLGFEVSIYENQSSSLEMLYESERISVESFPLKHRIPTYGYLFKEKISRRNIKQEAIKKYNLTVEEIRDVVKGLDIKRNDEIITNERLTYVKHQPKSFAYCSDTVYDPSICQHISEVDLLYHEATYTDRYKDKAKERMHSTASEAATIAKTAQVNKLVIGHFSSRYEDLFPLLDESRKIFANTELAIEGEIIEA